MSDRTAVAAEVAKRLNLTTTTLYTYVNGDGTPKAAGQAVLDLDYAEDSNADTDANFVLTGKGGLVELQASAEKEPFDEALFNTMLTLARQGITELVAAQKRAIAG